MNYWLITTEYPPLYGGGIGTYCYHTAKMLKENGHSVTVFIPDEKVRDYLVEKEEHIRLIRFNPNRTSMGTYLGYTANLSYEFAAITMDFIRKEGKPDLIESQEYLAIPYYILQFRLLKYPEFENVPIILTIHSPAFLYLHYNREGTFSFPNYWTGEMEKSCILCADRIITPSDYIIRELKLHTDIDDTKTSLVRNPYYFTEYEQPEITRNKIVFFGKLSPQKGVFEMFEYFKLLWDHGFPYTLMVVGGADKVYYPEMKTMGQIIHDKYVHYIQKGLVTFTGKIFPEQKASFLGDAHVILIPSLNDNLPYAAIEGMSMGKVVLASVQGGHAEIIKEGTNGFLFDHLDPESFGNKLKHILTLSNKELGIIGKCASETIKELLNYQLIYEQKLDSIKKVLNSHALPVIFPFTRNIFTVSRLEENKFVRGLLSVVIPYYNLGEYISECIESILSSDFRPIEILIINDGSTNRQSVEALEKFKQNPVIKIFVKDNEGLAKARNYGAEKASGEYLAFLDADDKVHPFYYSKAISVLKQYHNVFFVGCWVKYFGSKKQVWPAWNPEPPYILLHNMVNSSSLVYKTAAFLAGGLNDKAVAYGIEDYESVISMLENGYRGVAIPECLFYYRIRINSMYRALTKYKTLYSYQYIAQKHAGFYSKFAPEIFNILNANGPSFVYDNPSFGREVISRNIQTNNMVLKFKTMVKRYPALKRVLLRIADAIKLRQP